MNSPARLCRTNLVNVRLHIRVETFYFIGRLRSKHFSDSIKIFTISQETYNKHTTNKKIIQALRMNGDNWWRNRIKNDANKYVQWKAIIRSSSVQVWLPLTLSRLDVPSSSFLSSFIVKYLETQSSPDDYIRSLRVYFFAV